MLFAIINVPNNLILPIKTEFIVINTDQEFHINIEENVTIKQVQNFKYLGVNLNKKGYKFKRHC